MPHRTELRRDPFTRRWVIIAPGRTSRPHSFRSPQVRQKHEKSCPFCPGHEGETPPEVWRQNDAHGNWRVRVVPNKFPILTNESHNRQEVSGGFETVAGIGWHEVIIESPDHSTDLVSGGIGDIRAVLEAYRIRYRALQESGCAMIVIFRNHGTSAGTSLAHPHSQIVATPVVPFDVQHRLNVATQYADETGRNLYCDVLHDELSDGRRIILTNDRFVTFQPFAAASPFETWIMPRRQQASFGAATDNDLNDLATILRSALIGLHDALDDPDYNYIVQSAPVNDVNQAHFIWHLRVMPRLTTPAGFEIGTGMYVNPTSPEETALALRSAIPSGATGEI